jgi:phage terminase large subunit GpA-like protein
MIALVPRSENGTLDLSRELVRAMRAPRLRSLSEFAEQEIIIPDGPMKGRRFRCSTQPWSKLWFDQIDSGLFQRFAATGPSQSGKTLCCYVIPTLYHLFEIGETVICGVPKMEMAHDKWRQDFLPTIMASRYADLLPQRGKGSRGGQFDSVTFRNGATLKFMTGGGDDKSRAGFTSRVVVITETDGMDVSSELSREADPITQLEARTRSYGHRRRIFMECTVSTEEGRIWQEFTNGTASKIALPCPHCEEHVTPEREHFIGWDGAKNAIEAESMGKFFCPKCATAWSEDQRIAANRNAVILHKGQEIDGGQVAGDMPPTRTFGFRWTATNNLFASCAELASEEWVASQDIDQDNVQKGRNQFVWTIPHTGEDLMKLSVAGIAHRQSMSRRGIIPDNYATLTAGVDIGMRRNHWVVIAGGNDLSSIIIAYGIKEVSSDQFGPERGVRIALDELKEEFASWWPGRNIDECWVDSGWMTDSVYGFCLDNSERYWPTKGLGIGQERVFYSRPRRTSNAIREIGDGFHIERLQRPRVRLIEFDANLFKSRLHAALNCDPKSNEALLLHEAPEAEHRRFAEHCLAEKQTEEFVAGRGLVVRWVAHSKMNHYFDAASLALGALHRLRLKAKSTNTQQSGTANSWFANQRSG